MLELQKLELQLQKLNLLQVVLQDILQDFPSEENLKKYFQIIKNVMEIIMFVILIQFKKCQGATVQNIHIKAIWKMIKGNVLLDKNK